MKVHELRKLLQDVSEEAEVYIVVDGHAKVLEAACPSGKMPILYLHPRELED